MRRTSLLLALVLCFPMVAHADEASRRAKAKEMLTLLHMDQLMTQMMENVKQQSSSMAKQMFGVELTPAEQAKVDAFQDKLYALIDTQMGWKALEPEYIELYAKNFTEEELDGILAFYKSPVGMALVAKTPGMTADATKIVQARMETLGPQVQEMMKDFAASMAPALTAPPPPPPPPPPGKGSQK